VLWNLHVDEQPLTRILTSVVIADGIDRSLCAPTTACTALAVLKSRLICSKNARTAWMGLSLMLRNRARMRTKVALGHTT